MRSVSKGRIGSLLRQNLGASLIEYILLVSMIVLIAIMAVPQLTTGVKRTFCTAIDGLDGVAQTWWDSGACYTDSGYGDQDILF